MAQHAPSIPRAVGIYLTTRGQRYFSENLLDLLNRRGYELGDGGFDQWTYQAQEPVLLGQLPAHMLPFAKPLSNLRDYIKQWLLNSDLGDPLIHAQLTHISYSAKPTRFGLQIDPLATAQTMGDRGVVLNFQAEIPSLRVEVDNVSAEDSNNEFLGVFGADHPWTELAPRSEPLTVSIPLRLQLESSGGLRFEMLGIQTNLPAIDLLMGFDHPMHLPIVRVKVNGYAMTLNQATLEKELLLLQSQLLKAAQAYLSNYATENGPATINALINNQFANTLFSDINEMDPPGALVATGPADRYRWGVSPEEIHLTPNHLMLGLSAFIEDPKAKNPFAEVSRRQVSRPPVLNIADPATYDAAITINEDLVNRVIAMGYLRGYFPTLDVSGSAPLVVLQAPEFHFNSSSDRGKLRIKVMHKVAGLEESIAIRREVTFEMDVNARLIHTAQGSLSVVVDSVDTKSLKIDVSTINSLFRGTVQSKLLKELVSTNQDLAKKPKVIVAALPVPSQIGGIPIKIKDFRADPNGYLVLYTEYDLGR